MAPLLWIPLMVVLGAFFGWLIFQDPIIGVVGGTLVGGLIFMQRREQSVRRK